jgi:hypothetical protein
VITTVVSIDPSPYMEWQVRLLEESWRDVRQPGDLQIVSEVHPAAETMRYSPLNKPYAMTRLGDTHESVLIVDPDCIFQAPVLERAKRWRPVAHRYTYLSEAPAAMQAGIPILIHRSDLDRVAPMWLSEALVRRLHSPGEWIAEMYAYNRAAIRAGLSHDLRMWAAHPPVLDGAEYPIAHLCYEWDGWGKGRYQPWQDPFPGGTRSYAGQRMQRLVAAVRAAA